jgi:RHS repeat-associated protein
VTRYLVDDLNSTGYPQVVEEVVNGAVQRQYTNGLQRISENQLVSNTWTPSFYGYDGFGTVRQLTNSSGTITDTYDYDAFGNKVNSTGTTPNNYLYRGEQFDPDLGIYYLRARYYNPLTGRFMGRDPEDGDVTNPATLHRYMYANGDPVNAFDPSGRVTATWPGAPPQATVRPPDAVEYGLIVSLVALGTIAADRQVACAINIELTVEALKVEGDTNIVPDLPTCSAKGKPRSCRQCDPPVGAGDFGYRLDIGQLSDHFDKASQTLIPAGQTHWHLFVCNQTPPSEGCICSWRKLRDIAGVGVTPPGFDIKTNSCTGGGIQ